MPVHPCLACWEDQWLWRPLPGEPSVPSCAHSTCQGGHWLCSQDRCPGECTVLGGRHYITFDHQRFSFLGACAYTLVQVGGSCRDWDSGDLPWGALPWGTPVPGGQRGLCPTGLCGGAAADHN